MQTAFIDTANHLDNMDPQSVGILKESDLPQIADTDEVMIEVIQDISAMPHDLIEAQIHHQIDPSYE